MFGIGGFELFIILLFAVVVIGPKELPNVSKNIGIFIKKLQNAKSEVEDIAKNEISKFESENSNKDTSLNNRTHISNNNNSNTHKPHLPDNADAKRNELKQKQDR